MTGIAIKARALMSLIALVGGVRAAEAQKTHEVRLEANREKEVYRFVPSQVTAAPGDVIVFKVVSGAPHSIVFDAEGLSPAVRSALSSAVGAKSDELGSPMLTKNGAEYRLVLPRLPGGTYRFFCLPHRAYDMRGEIVVKK
jgi:plastocyanin